MAAGMQPGHPYIAPLLRVPTLIATGPLLNVLLWLPPLPADVPQLLLPLPGMNIEASISDMAFPLTVPMLPALPFALLPDRAVDPPPRTPTWPSRDGPSACSAIVPNTFAPSAPKSIGPPLPMPLPPPPLQPPPPTTPHGAAVRAIWKPCMKAPGPGEGDGGGGRTEAPVNACGESVPCTWPPSPPAVAVAARAL